MNKKFLVFMIFFGLIQTSYAQDQQCGESLNKARDDFNAGHLEGIAGMLHDCINNGFSKEQKVEAYRILTITYLYLEDPFGAEQSFLALLEIEPEYRITPADPVELEYLSRQYITTPIISYSAKIGTNFSTVTVLHRNTIGNENDRNWKYSSRNGVNVSGAMDVHFNKVVSLTVELEFSLRKYIYTDTLFSNIPDAYQALEQIRSNWHGSLPVSIRFTYPGIKYYPYIYGGYSPSYTFSSNANNKRDPQSVARIEGSLDLKHITPDFSHSLIFGAGLKRRLGYKYVMIDLRYRLGMTNMLNPLTQYDISVDDIREDLLTYGLAIDDHRWNGFEVTAGVVWPIYKARAKNEVTIQTVVKKWFGKKKKRDE